MYSSTVISVVLLVSIGQCFALVWVDCGTPTGNLKGVNVTGCENVDVCPITKGTNVTISFDFISAYDGKNATSVVHGIIAHVPVPYPIPHADACSTPNSGVTCPVKKGTRYNYTSQIPVEPSYPTISLTVKWELKNENNEDLFCAEIPISIK